VKISALCHVFFRNYGLFAKYHFRITGNLGKILLSDVLFKYLYLDNQLELLIGY